MEEFDDLSRFFDDLSRFASQLIYIEVLSRKFCYVGFYVLKLKDSKCNSLIVINKVLVL